MLDRTRSEAASKLLGDDLAVRRSAMELDPHGSINPDAVSNLDRG